MARNHRMGHWKDSSCPRVAMLQRLKRGGGKERERYVCFGRGGDVSVN